MRPLGSAEAAAVARFIDALGDGLLARWLEEEDAELWTHDASPQAVFVVRHQLATRLRSLPPDPAPRSAGLRIAEWTRGGLRLTLEGASEIGSRTTTRRVVVRDKAAQLFLYGRDILGEGVLKVQGDAPRGSHVFVVNRRGDVLGLARVLQRLPGRGRVLEPIWDRGWYLRSGG